MHTVAGVFHSRAAGEEAIHELMDHGIAGGAISLITREAAIRAQGPEIIEQKLQASSGQISRASLPFNSGGVGAASESNQRPGYQKLLSQGRSIVVVNADSEQEASMANFVFESYEGQKLEEAFRDRPQAA